MWLTKTGGAIFLAGVLLFSLVTGCGNDEKNAAKPKDEATQGDQNTPDENKQAEENPVPIVDVSLGLDPKDVVARYEGGELTVEEFENYLQVQAFINPQAGFAIQEKDPQSLKMFVETYVAEESMANKAPEIKNVDEEANNPCESH